MRNYGKNLIIQIVALSICHKKELNMKIEYLLNDIKNGNESAELFEAFKQILENPTKEINIDFFKQINAIIFNYTKINKNEFLQINLPEEKIKKIKECLILSRKLYTESVNELSEKKLIISLLLLRFYEQSFLLLSDIKVSKNFLDKIIEMLKNVSITFNIKDDARYGEKKWLDAINEAKTLNDYSKMLKMMDELNNSPFLFEGIESSWTIIFQWIWFIRHEIIIELITTMSPETVEVVFYSLKDEIHNIVIHLPQNNPQKAYPVLRGFMLLFHCLEEKTRGENAITLQELPDCTDWIIEMFHNKIINIPEYIPAMRIAHLKSFNYYLGKAIAKDISLFNKFLSAIDLDAEVSVVFSESFLDNVNQNRKILFVGNKIIYKYFSEKINTYDFTNKNIGCLGIIIQYFYLKYKTKEKYIKKLNKTSSMIIKIQSSWDFTNIKKFWIYLFYLAMANNYLEYHFTEKQLKEIIPIVFDERERINQGYYCIDTIIALLTSFVEKIKLKKINNDVVEFSKKSDKNE